MGSHPNPHWIIREQQQQPNKHRNLFLIRRMMQTTLSWIIIRRLQQQLIQRRRNTFGMVWTTPTLLRNNPSHPPRSTTAMMSATTTLPTVPIECNNNNLRRLLRDRTIIMELLLRPTTIHTAVILVIIHRLTNLLTIHLLAIHLLAIHLLLPCRTNDNNIPTVRLHLALPGLLLPDLITATIRLLLDRRRTTIRRRRRIIRGWITIIIKLPPCSRDIQRSSSNSSNSPQMERVEPQSEEENSLGLSDHEKTLCNNSPYENIMQSYLLMKEHTISNERDGAIKQPLNPTTRQQIRHSSTIYFHVILLLLLPITLTNGQQGSNNNPNNKFCGVNYNEAHLFCHLPPEQSLPCPNGSDENCPYGMPCWEIREECTPPPTPEPTHYPTSSPAARTDRPTLPRSTIAGDHNFCGLGFTNLFG
mmetsp:Transcript_20053/g.37764  ORF Transcript_20053/g.37764 Transcript_20053/m.37764 type:complete len:417 (-) Transcript_20053:2390-3640(-)